jgi:hypothetical protein
LRSDAAIHWLRGKLAKAALVVIVLETTTFSNRDVAAKERISRLKMEGPGANRSS